MFSTGLETMGVIGLLARAKSRGLIPAVGPLIDALRSSGGFFVSDSLRATVLRQCGEQ
jgi:predicted nucleic acid-binding protein